MLEGLGQHLISEQFGKHKSAHVPSSLSLTLRRAVSLDGGLVDAIHECPINSPSNQKRPECVTYANIGVETDEERIQIFINQREPYSWTFVLSFIFPCFQISRDHANLSY